MEHIVFVFLLLLCALIFMGTKIEGFSNCDYSVNWVPDPDNFKITNITENPYAKGDYKHCRSNSQCKSNSCKQWYCDPIDETEYTAKQSNN
jgi:hypothetical protein